MSGLCHEVVPFCGAARQVIACGRMSTRCKHLSAVKTAKPNTNGCEECLKMGDTWVHLRLCRTCGHVGCCDDSKNRHATSISMPRSIRS